MSLSFDICFDRTVLSPLNEGGFVLSHIPGDPGGQTFAGIARNYWRDWYGWQLIDNGTPLDSPVLRDLVRDFYWKNFWLEINGENLSPRLAQQVFDMAVNSDPRDAAMCLQRAIGTVTVDGDIGPRTVGAVRAMDQLRLVMLFNAERAAHYAKTPQARKASVGGWFNRLATQLRRGAE